VAVTSRYLDHLTNADVIATVAVASLPPLDGS
jgi:hypothetical protein